MSRPISYAYLVIGSAMGADSPERASFGENDRLDGVIEDVRLLLKFSRNLAGRSKGQLQMREERCGCVYSQGVGGTDLRDVLHHFLSAVDVDFFFVAFTGHGSKPQILNNQIGGDWMFGVQSALTFTGFVRIWESCHSNRVHAGHKPARLAILNDSCYSGSWCDKLRSIPDDHPWSDCAGAG